MFLHMNSDFPKGPVISWKTENISRKSRSLGCDVNQEKMSCSSFQPPIYRWGLRSKMSGKGLSYDLPQIIHELQYSVSSVVKSRRWPQQKPFKSYLWSPLVSVKSPQRSLEGYGERAARWGCSHTPCPFSYSSALTEKEPLQMLEQSQGTTFIINILLKMDSHCP